MRITCPNCTSGFDIPTELLGRRGRTLKCATCGHGWFQAAGVEEIDLAEIMNENAAAEEKPDFGGTPSSRKNLPDTAAIAAAANEAFTQAFGRPPPKVDPPAQPAAAPPPAQQPQQPAVPPGARSIMSKRNDQFQQAPVAAQSMMSPEEEAAQAMGGSLLLEPGQDGGPGQAPQSVMGQEAAADAAVSMAAPQDPVQQGVAAGAPGAMMDPNAAAAAALGADAGNPLMEQVAQQPPPPDPAAWLNQYADADGIPGVVGMPGMPGASGMPGMPGGPGDAASALPPAWNESMMNQAPPQGPGAGVVSQLTGQHIQAPGEAARSMLTGEAVGGPGLGAQSMLTGEQVGAGAAGVSQMGASGGPEAAGTSQMGGDMEGPGQAAVSLLDGTEHAARAPDGEGASAEDGVTAGPGLGGGSLNELLQEDKDGIEDDLFEGDGEGVEDGGEHGGAGDGESEEDDLVDPDEDTPDFGNMRDDDDLDDLDDDPLADFEEESPKKQKKKKKPIDPAYITAAVLFIIVCLIGSMLYVARDELSQMWPALKGVYEALNVEESPGEGLRLSQPQPSRMIIGGVQTLVVNGFITNLTDAAQPVPNVKLMLIDENNNIVQETSSAPSAATIDPNSSIPYRIELQLPVDSATGILVEFD